MGCQQIAVVLSFVLTVCCQTNGAALTNRDKFYEDVRQLLALTSPDRTNQVYNEEDDDYEGPLKAPYTPKEVASWPEVPLKVGQISAVAINSRLQPVIFHRADRLLEPQVFNSTNDYVDRAKGPIRENTVLTLDTRSGAVQSGWGSDMFYMPHGLTIDRHDNIWVTDVALHQAFKFRPGDQEPALIFGRRFESGPGIKHLCMPTAVAVASGGEIFIADGYCNNRILKYNAAGGLLRIIPNPPEFLSLQTPHGLTLLERYDRLCIADRENMRVVCPRAGLYSDRSEKSPALTIQQPDMGRVFDVASLGSLVYAVNGPTSAFIPVRGFTIDPRSETVIDHWSPKEGFQNPHSITVCPNGSALYVAEIGPNKLWKFELVPQDVASKKKK